MRVGAAAGSLLRVAICAAAVVGGCLIGGTERLSAAESPAESAAELCKWIPAEAVAAVMVSHPADLLRKLDETPAIRELESGLRLAELLERNQELRQLRAAVSLLEGQLQSDWKTILGDMTAGGLVLAVLPDNQVVVIVEARDAEVLRKVNDFVLNLARLDPGNAGKREAVREAEYRGVRGWALSPEESHAVIDRRLVLCNSAELLRRIIDQAQDGGEGLAGSAQFKAAVASLPASDIGVFVDFRLFRDLPQVQEGLRQARSPLSVLFLAGLTEALGGADWLALGLAYEDESVRCALRSGGDTALCKDFGFAMPASPGEGVLPNLDVPGRIMALTMYRDLRDFYARKNELFPERTSGLIFFENMMGIFFSGRNFTDEVLTELDPHVRIVVARQQFTPETGVPEVQIPALAVVFRMRNPQRFGPIVEEGWQKALGLINFVRGQDAQPGLILDRMEYQGVKYTVSYFSTVDEDLSQPLPMRFNFRPVVIAQGEDLILASSEGLGKSIMDAIRASADSDRPLPDVSALLETDLAAVAQVIEDNREALIRQNMLAKGREREEAVKEWEHLKRAVELFGKSVVKVGVHDGRPALDAKVSVKLSTLEQFLPAE
ncbi:MAG: DUF3352 domain-containing protein [Thermogutta sp.]|nr:DUF3352 domain-containing protein [Thermogutta sp.]